MSGKNGSDHILILLIFYYVFTYFLQLFYAHVTVSFLLNVAISMSVRCVCLIICAIFSMFKICILSVIHLIRLTFVCLSSIFVRHPRGLVNGPRFIVSFSYRISQTVRRTLCQSSNLSLLLLLHTQTRTLIFHFSFTKVEH